MSSSEAPAAPAHVTDTHDALQPGSRIGEFLVERVLGVGGFGIVYLAVDQVLLRQVAIKEYMPTALSGRGAAGRVVLRAASHRDTFDTGLRSFVKEAQLLASFDHPSLVKVHRFWEENGTAYMVMPYYEGHTLSHRRFTERPVDEARLRGFIEPLLDALDLLHRSDVFHRDISPDNIIMLPNGRPVLLDFGAARRVISDRTQTLTAVLKPSFAPVEQYGDVPGMRQGPWTDLYALGAVVHYLVTGERPPPAVVRAVRDAMPVLSLAAPSPCPRVSRSVLAGIDWALAVAPHERPQSVAELRNALDGVVAPPAPTPRHVVTETEPTTTHTAWHSTVRLAPHTVTHALPKPHRWRNAAAALAVVMTAGAAGAWMLGRKPSDQDAAGAALAQAAALPPVTVASSSSLARSAEAKPRPKPQAAPAAPRSGATPERPVTRAAGPTQICAGRNAFMRAVCETRECLRPRFRGHPQCARPDDADRRRDGSTP